MQKDAERLLETLTLLKRIETLFKERGVSATEETIGLFDFIEFTHACDRGGTAPRLTWYVEAGPLPGRHQEVIFEYDHMEIFVDLDFGRNGDTASGRVTLHHDALTKAWKAKATVELGREVDLPPAWHALKKDFHLHEEEKAIDEVDAFGLLDAMARACVTEPT